MATINHDNIETLKNHVRDIIMSQNNAFWKAFTQHYTTEELLELVNDIYFTEDGILFSSSKLKGDIDITFLINQAIGYALCLMDQDMEQNNQVKKGG